ncbi:hypothetical protein EDC01DRAFT_630770 [Geopyxis carbonaria]|nr:hypothetical protein EDC01DRAFT_630770 [Geopyxis carbonaria]
MQDPEVGSATDSLQELRLDDSQSSATALEGSGGRVTSTNRRSVDINKVDSTAGRQRMRRNQYLAVTYDAPYKGNPAKRQRPKVPEVSLKRVRADEHDESSASPNEEPQFEPAKHGNQDSCVVTNMPSGQAPADQHQSLKEINRLLSNARIEYEKMQEAMNELRAEHEQIVSRNAILQARYTLMKARISKIIIRERAVVEAENKQKLSLAHFDAKGLELEDDQNQLDT